MFVVLCVIFPCFILSVSLHVRLIHVYRRSVNQLISYVICIDDLINRSDYELFRKICSETHSLYHLLPPYRTSDLRLRGHPFQLPDYCTDLHKKSFIVRSLYEFIK